MKKAIVFLITALTVASVCLPSSVVLAEGNAVSVESRSSGSKQSATSSKVVVNDNLKSVKNVMNTIVINEGIPDGRFLIKDNLIFVGYINSKDTEGFVSSSFESGSDTVDSVNFGVYTDSEDGDVENSKFSWNFIKGVKTLDELKDYISKNKKDIVKANKDKLQVFPLGADSPTCVLVFDKNGSYIGSIDTNDLEASNSLYKDFVTKAYLKIKVDLKNNLANVVLNYDFSKYPTQLGGEELMTFDITNEKGDIIISTEEARDNYMDLKNTVKGETKVIPIGVNGDFTVRFFTSQRELKLGFDINGIKEPKQDVVDTSKPKITVANKPNGVLKGTPHQITIYTDKDTNVLFNGQSDGVFGKEHTFTIKNNGTYEVVADTKTGVSKETVVIDGFVDSVDSINLSAYGDGGSGTLPQTGNATAVVVFGIGILVLLGGMVLVIKC